MRLGVGNDEEQKYAKQERDLAQINDDTGP